MDITQLDLSRLQFATTTIYHFFFVPVTIGLAFLVATLHTMWYRKNDPDLRRLTRFFGTLLVINIAIGVVTGLVQEFEFGMNWSEYSRFVGDVFGAPLAMEGLAAFFLESTFLGLWLFGWNILPKKVHLACVWAVAFGAALSAAFIMAANSWMQHPVGYEINSTTGRPELTSIGALFTNPVFVWGYIHVILASLHDRQPGDALGVGVAPAQEEQPELFVRTAKLALAFMIPVSMLVLMVGSHLGVIETKYQPMKVAAMEAQWETCAPVLVLGGPDRWLDQQRRGPDQDHRDPAPAVAARDRIVERPGRRDQRASGAVREAVRTRRLHPQPVHPVLVDAGDGLHRVGAADPRAVGTVAVASEEVGDIAGLPLGRDLGGLRAVHHEHRRLVADRERSSAVGGPGTAAYRRRQLTLGQSHRGRHQSGVVLDPLPHSGRRLGFPDDSLRPPRTRARTRRA